MDSFKYRLGRHCPSSVVLFRRSGMWLRPLESIFRPCSRFFIFPVPTTWHTPNESEHLQVYELLRLRSERPQQQLTKHTWRLERSDLAVHRHECFHRHHSLLYRRVYETERALPKRQQICRNHSRELRFSCDHDCH